MATPRVLGHEFLFTANLCFARDASETQLVHIHTQRWIVTAHTQQRLVRPPATSHDADHATHRALDHLLRARLGSLTRVLPSVRVVPNDGHVVARSSGPAHPGRQSSPPRCVMTVPSGTLAQREHVADRQDWRSCRRR